MVNEPDVQNDLPPRTRLTARHVLISLPLTTEGNDGQVYHAPNLVGLSVLRHLAGRGEHKTRYSMSVQVNPSETLILAASQRLHSSVSLLQASFPSLLPSSPRSSVSRERCCCCCLHRFCQHIGEPVDSQGTVEASNSGSTGTNSTQNRSAAEYARNDTLTLFLFLLVNAAACDDLFPTFLLVPLPDDTIRLTCWPAPRALTLPHAQRHPRGNLIARAPDLLIVSASPAGPCLAAVPLTQAHGISTFPAEWTGFASFKHYQNYHRCLTLPPPSSWTLVTNSTVQTHRPTPVFGRDVPRHGPAGNYCRRQ